MTNTFRLAILFCLAFTLSSCDRHHRATTSSQNEAPPTTAHYGQVPLSFEANQGQAKETVKFLARGQQANLYLTQSEAALEVYAPQEKRAGSDEVHAVKSALVKMKLMGAKDAPQLRGVDELPGKSNYFTGKDPKEWKRNIPTYQKVKYEQVYQGIDLVYYGNQQQLEYDFVVSPGNDPKAIRFTLEGAQNISLNAQGELVLKTEAGEVKQHKPVIYQQVAGERKEIAGEYQLQANGEIGFAVGEYDNAKPLVIDPVIVYATATGTNGVASSAAEAVAVDQQGCAYVGKNFGPNVTPGAYSNGSGVSVIKFNQTGTAALYAVTMSGGSFDRILAMAVDAQGNCYLTGQATSSNFVSTPGAFQTDPGITCSACRSAFVTKINPTGSDLVYSTFLKGDDTTDTKTINGQGIAVDAQGCAYVTGQTNAKDFPTTPGAFQTKLNTDKLPAQDAFVTKLNPTGTGLIYSTYLGAGDNADQGKNIAVDAAGNAYVVGLTGNGYSGYADHNPKTPFPKTSGSYQTSADVVHGGIFLSKFNATGSALIYSTLIGTGPGSADQIPFAIDSDGNVYLAGSTQSTDFPVTPSAFKTTFTAPAGRFQAFITKVNATGSGLVYSTFVGGNGGENCVGVGVDPQGNASIIGITDSSDFPQTGVPDPFVAGAVFATKLNATGTDLLHSRFFGFIRPETFAIDRQGNLYVLGTKRPDFSLTSGAFETKGSPVLAKLRMPSAAATVSAANYTGSPLASESIVSSFGDSLATTTQAATTIPLPTTLGGTTVKVRDSLGTERNAPLFYVSPSQVNLQIPAGTANGAAMITITSSDGTQRVTPLQINNVVPSFFSVDATGRGWAAAQVQRNGTFEEAVKFDLNKAQFVGIPIDLGTVNDQVYLVLYGTGIRLRSNLNNVTATIGGVNATVSYAGPHSTYIGVDQVNILIPRSLIGKGAVDVEVTVDGKVSNTVKVAIK